MLMKGEKGKRCTLGAVLKKFGTIKTASFKFYPRKQRESDGGDESLEWTPFILFPKSTTAFSKNRQNGKFGDPAVWATQQD